MLKECRYIPTLETDRLILRKLKPEDAEDLKKWLGRDEVYTYWGRPASKGEKAVTVGEVCLLTNDVPRLAAFYRRLLGVDNGSDDAVHQFILTEGTALAVYNNGTEKAGGDRTICLAFTVEDIIAAYEKVKALGARIAEPPAERPWGAVNMSLYDPDGNLIYLRSFPAR